MLTGLNPGQDPEELMARKALLRREVLDRRGAMPAGAGAGRALARTVLQGAPPPPGAVVAGFMPMPGEVDLHPLLRALSGRGHELVLPVTTARGRPLVFRRWRPGDELVPGRFGTLEPSRAAPELRPDYLLVPLLAFDRRGHRLGYGAGYYDRTLAGLPQARALGVAHAWQEVREVPSGRFDVPLRAVATEADLVVCRAAPPGAPGRAEDPLDDRNPGGAA